MPSRLCSTKKHGREAAALSVETWELGFGGHMSASIAIVAGYLSICAGVFAALIVSRSRRLPNQKRGFARSVTASAT
jgi:hypothetical protein